MKQVHIIYSCVSLRFSEKRETNKQCTDQLVTIYSPILTTEEINVNYATVPLPSITQKGKKDEERVFSGRAPVHQV